MKKHESRSSNTEQCVARILISGVALTLVAARTLGVDDIDSTAVVLLVIALTPWLPLFLTRAEMPGGWLLEFRALRRRQEAQHDEIEEIRFLIQTIVTQTELTILQRLSSDDPYRVRVDDSSPFFAAELNRLRALRLIEGQPGRGIRSLLVSDGQDREAKEHFRITSKGKEYLRFRESAEAGRRD